MREIGWPCDFLHRRNVLDGVTVWACGAESEYYCYDLAGHLCINHSHISGGCCQRMFWPTSAVEATDLGWEEGDYDRRFGEP